MKGCTCDPRQPGTWCASCERRIDAAQDDHQPDDQVGDGPWTWIGGAA